MTLLEKQMQLPVMLGALVVFMRTQGYGCTYGEAYRPPELCEIYAKQGRGIRNSLHAQRLAVDLNLFRRTDFPEYAGKIPAKYTYITDSDDPIWIVLHNRWEALGGAPMIKNDANHFSIEHEGVR